MATQIAEIPRAAEPLPLLPHEIAILAGYLQQIASAQRMAAAAQKSMEDIAKTIGGRSGYPPEQKFRLSDDAKSLIPLP